jgi:phytanoyl-CoA hydroxylase
MGEAITRGELRVLTEEQVAFYEEHGYLRIPQVFAEEELEAMDRELLEVLATWGLDVVGWTGDWKKDYMEDELIHTTKLVGVEGVDLYSASWAAAIFNPNLCDAMADLIGPAVEYHHTTTHVKPPQTGDAVPLHQDSYFYTHSDDRFVASLVHLDDTDDVNGCIRFLDGSHKNGIVEHVSMSAAGPVVPYLPTETYRLEDTVPVPARRGDVVCFNYHTMHGSKNNRTSKLRRLVRIGYRNPENLQTHGEWITRPGPMVRGLRPRAAKQEPLPVPGRLEAEAESRRRQLEKR